MDNKVTNLKLYRIKKILDRRLYITVVKNSDFFPSAYQTLINEDPHAFIGLSDEMQFKKATFYSLYLEKIEHAWKELKHSLATNQRKYRIPGIFSHYRNTLNPVVAFHNELQKVKLTLSKKHVRRKWIESILKEQKKEMIRNVISDIQLLSSFIDTWHKDEYIMSHEVINCAISLKLRLLECLKGFRISGK